MKRVFNKIRMDSTAEDHCISFIDTVDSVCFCVSVFGLVCSESSVCVRQCEKR